MLMLMSFLGFGHRSERRVSVSEVWFPKLTVVKLRLGPGLRWFPLFRGFGCFGLRVSGLSRFKALGAWGLGGFRA